MKTEPVQLETRRAASGLLCTSVGQTASALATDSTGMFVLSGLSVSRHICLVVCVCVCVCACTHVCGFGIKIHLCYVTTNWVDICVCILGVHVYIRGTCSCILSVCVCVCVCAHAFGFKTHLCYVTPKFG